MAALFPHRRGPLPVLAAGGGLRGAFLVSYSSSPRLLELAKAAIQQQEAKNGSREGEKGASHRR